MSSSTKQRPILAFFALFVISFASPPAFAQTPFEKRLERAVGKVVREAGIVADEPGVAILIWVDGRRAFRKGYGLATLGDAPEAIAPSTTFELASLTKPFTALAVLRLAEGGQLSLDDDLRRHLPEVDLPSAKRTITIEHLLRHTSGLPEYLQFDYPEQGEKGYWSNDDYLAVFRAKAPELALRSPVGRKHEYCNTNYMLLASIVARVTGKPFRDALRELVLAPAGMNDSFVVDSPTAAPPIPAGKNRSLGYTRDESGAWVASWGAPPARNEQLLTCGDGALWSNLNDLKSFDQALREHRLISAKTLEKALATSKTLDGQLNIYGHGWSIYPGDAGGGNGGRNGFGHNGSWSGFETSYYRYEPAHRTTVILSNRGGFDVDGLWYKLNDAVDAALTK